MKTQSPSANLARAVPAVVAIELMLGAVCCDPAQAHAPTSARAQRAANAASSARTPAWATDGPPVETTVYRCGNSYSARPCGDTRPLDVDDPRTEAQRLQAADVAAREQRLVAWLEAQRREREAAPAAVAPSAGRGTRAAAPCGASTTPDCPAKRVRLAIHKTSKATASAASAAAPVLKAPTANPARAAR